MPASQTIEGGVQVRVTKNGLKTIIAAAKQILANTIGQTGVCIPQQQADLGISTLYACYNNSCAGGAKGCRVNLSLGNVATQAVSTETLRVNVTFSASTSLPLKIPTFLGDITCTASGSLSNARLEVDVRVGTSATTGELTLNLARIGSFDLNPDISVCGLDVSGLTDFLLDLLDTDLGHLIIDLVTPTINNFIQGLLPKPLGVEGVLNLGGLISSALPSNIHIDSKVELRAVPGGYAQLPADGISLGVIVGVNADRNTATRGPNDTSEPALCVPQWQGPDLAMPPASLTKTGRGTFSLKPAGAFLGSPDPANDVAVGISQTFLDLAGHHVVASGALCVGVGSSLVPQLNLGTVGLLIRSLSELGTGTEPILIQIRPTKPITFDIGTGSMTSPYLTAHLQDVDVDFYALIFERYIRAFTVTFNADVGVNAEFMINAQHKPIITPTLVGLDASKIKVTISNSTLLRETPAMIEGVFPTVLNLFLPLLAQAIPDIPVPAFEGFTLGALKLGKETTTQDDFLAVYASLTKASGKPEDDIVERASTEAKVTRVSTPSPERVRAYLTEGKDGALPEVELDLGGSAPRGGDLEWQWNLDNGMWRPFSRDSHIIIRDLALAVQGRHTIQVRARAVGDYTSTDLQGVALDVVIDSAAPSLLMKDVRRDGDALVLHASDLVTAERYLEWAFGGETDNEPATPWTASEGRFSLTELKAFGPKVKVFVRDEMGNVASTILTVGDSRDEVAGGGCAVGSGAGGSGGAVLLLAVALAFVAGRRRAVLLALLLGACSQAKELAPIECKNNDECKDMCQGGQEGFCDPASKKCVCLTAIPLGNVGAFSDIAAAPDGSYWVSAYNSEYGDLMVAKVTAMGRVGKDSWEFVDGVPDVPKANALTPVRNGINDLGDDVGRYTSIALGGGGPMVSHYDQTHQSLKFSTQSGGRWTSHVVDAGVVGSKDVGRYTTLSVDSMGRPGIGYLAIIKEGTARKSEVRWAQAKTATPLSQSDWTTSVVESKAAPADPSMGMLNDIPFVNGVFINSARTSDGDPVLVYYDHVAGDLKLAQWDKAGGKFKAAVTIDGTDAGEDVGWYPSVAVASDGKVHVSYVDAAHSNLRAIVYPGGQPEVVDDGMRMDGTTTGGLPRPVFHFVGGNSGIVVSGTSRAVVYQDATSQELVLATRGASAWTHAKVAGSDMPYKGAYGFFASCAFASGDVILSTFALNQTTYEQWIELFRQKMN